MYKVHSEKTKTYTKLASTDGAMTSRGIHAAKKSRRGADLGTASIALGAFDMQSRIPVTDGRRATRCRGGGLMRLFLRFDGVRHRVRRVLRGHLGIVDEGGNGVHDRPAIFLQD